MPDFKTKQPRGGDLIDIPTAGAVVTRAIPAYAHTIIVNASAEHGRVLVDYNDGDVAVDTTSYGYVPSDGTMEIKLSPGSSQYIHLSSTVDANTITVTYCV